MADRRETNVTSEQSFSTSATNVFDVYTDYVVQRQIDAANVPPRQKLDISFSDASKIGDKKSGSNQEAYEKAHGKLYDMTHKNTIPWRNYVVYIVLLTMLTCCFTYSKYVSGATGSSSNAVVASFKVETVADSDLEVEVSNNINNGTIKFDGIFDISEKTYAITAKNYSEVGVWLTWSCTSNNNKNCTATLTSETSDEKGDASTTQLYLSAATANADGELVPSERVIDFIVTPDEPVFSGTTITNLPSGGFNVIFYFDQAD